MPKRSQIIYPKFSLGYARDCSCEERDAQIEPAPTRGELKAGMFGEDFPPVELPVTRNGFRPGNRHPYFQKNEHPLISTSYRYGNPKDYGASLTSITGTTVGASTLQGHRVGIASREKQPSRPVLPRNGRQRNCSSLSARTEHRQGFLYPDAASGGNQSFQERLTEIANLEGDTIRFEKTRRGKKKAKQEK